MDSLSLDLLKEGRKKAGTRRSCLALQLSSSPSAAQMATAKHLFGWAGRGTLLGFTSKASPQTRIESDCAG